MPTIGAEPAPILRLAALAAAALALGAGPSPAGGGSAPSPTRAMAVTVDDLPALPSSDVAEMRRITDGVLAALRQHQVTAVGFVNENKLEPTGERAARLALLRSWLDAGHDLGNHTYSHPDLQRVPLEEFQRDVLLFDFLRRKAAGRGDTATVDRLRDAYVDYTVSFTEQMEALSRETFGREIPQVLLVHANATNAASLGELLDRLAGRGYRFVALDEALADGAWRTPDEYVGARGPSWLYRFRVAKGLPLGLEREPDPPKWVLDLYCEAQR
jgi:peptidoglycan/xylan/chitin deacetylase (PgdA/CDA1 family)